MAVKTSLRLLARKIGDAVRAFAAGEGWDRDTIAIAGTFDEPNERIYLTVGTDRPIDELRWHAGIKDAIRREFGGSSYVSSQVNLVIKTVGHLDEIYYGLILGDDDIDITDLL